MNDSAIIKNIDDFLAQNNSYGKIKCIIDIYNKMYLETKNNNIFINEFVKDNKDKISFVGISNWFIDASKMNRVIYNVVQDPDEEDIIETGKEIAKSYEINGENYSQRYGDIILRLSKAYYKYISKKKNEADKNKIKIKRER